MAAYRLYTVVPRLVSFINDLANWYVRLNRGRFKGHDGVKAENSSLCTLARVMLTLSTAMAPFTPFFSEFLYQNLRFLLPEKEREDSIHYLSYPEPDESLVDATLERQVSRMQAVIELGRLARERRRRPLKQPLLEFVVYQSSQEYLDDVKALESYILDELNVRTLTLRLEKGGAAIALKAVPDPKRLGQRFRGDRRKVEEAISKLSSSALEAFEASGEVKVEGHVLTKEDVTLVREFTGDTSTYEAAWNEQVLTVLHVSPGEELELEGHMREVQNRVQRLRKAASLQAGDPRAVTVYWSLSHAQSKEATDSAAAVRRSISQHLTELQKKTKSTLVEGNAPQGAQVLQQGTSKVNNVDFSVSLVVV
jgi:isoleucyl-tRNA synthetase